MSAFLLLKTAACVGNEVESSESESNDQKQNNELRDTTILSRAEGIIAALSLTWKICAAV